MFLSTMYTGLVGFVIVSLAEAQFVCYSCSYTVSSDPSINYECVTNHTHVQQGPGTLPCQAPYLCITRSVYNQDMTRMRSVLRTCQPQQEICSGDDCCNMDGVYPTCEHKCRDDLCNDRNPERRFKNPTGVNDNGKNDACALQLLTCIMYIAITFLWYVV